MTPSTILYPHKSNGGLSDVVTCQDPWMVGSRENVLGNCWLALELSCHLLTTPRAQYTIETIRSGATTLEKSKP